MLSRASTRCPASRVVWTAPTLTPAMRTSSPVLRPLRLAKPAMRVYPSFLKRCPPLSDSKVIQASATPSRVKRPTRMVWDELFMAVLQLFETGILYVDDGIEEVGDDRVGRVLEIRGPALPAQAAVHDEGHAIGNVEGQ